MPRQNAKGLIYLRVNRKIAPPSAARFAFHEKIDSEFVSKSDVSAAAHRLLHCYSALMKLSPREPLQRLSPSWPG